MNFNSLSSNLMEQLMAIVGVGNLSSTQIDLDQHARDQSHHPAHAAEVVVWPRSGEQVAAVLKLAHENRIPVTPWGVGTSLEGNPIPVWGGILLSFERMTQIIQVHAEDFQVTVQPGIGHVELNEHLARYGLFFAPDPGANATIGGMLANNASGIRTVRYGASKDNVLQMRVALADGRLIRVGSRSIKQSAGYDLLHLIVGSEGTLGVITEATLKLVPIPAYMSAVVAAFPTVQAAVQAIVDIKGSGLEPAALELIDARHAALLREAEGVDFPENANVVFMEFHAAHEATLQAGLIAVEEICEEHGSISIRTTTDPQERRKLWHARHSSYEITLRAHKGKRFFINDVAVPISAYPELIAHIEQLRDDLEIKAFLIGHAGDGNIHVEILYGDEQEFEKALAMNKAVVLKALELEGTATGEHGVGVGKAAYMAEEHGLALDVMRTIKQALDPHGILNPGKIFPESVPVSAQAAAHASGQ